MVEVCEAEDEVVEGYIYVRMSNELTVEKIYAKSNTAIDYIATKIGGATHIRLTLNVIVCVQSHYSSGSNICK